MASQIVMRACILSIGSELLRGDIVDTNSAYLARELTNLGFEVVRVATYPDTLATLTEGVSDALRAANVIVCTGGLGPTADDLTRDAVAAALGEDISLDAGLSDRIERQFASMQRSMPESNLRQSGLIPSATVIPNDRGTAPGWYVEREGRLIVTLPGPPNEMKPMWREFVAPRLEAMTPGQTSIRSLMTFGMGESAVEDRLEAVIRWRPEVTVATYAKETGVQVHISARTTLKADADSLADEAAARVRSSLGDAVYGEGTETLASAVGRVLRRADATFAVMESASGGELSNLITDVDGSSAYFVGGMIAYTRATKRACGVDDSVMDQYGLISPQTARAMASAVREGLSSTFGIGITGIAGSEEVEGHPPGTCFVAVATPDAHMDAEIHRPGERAVAKRYFAHSALDLLRKSIGAVESV